jgi:hypothetical protein
VYLLGPVVKAAGFTTLLILMTGIAALTTIIVAFLPSANPRVLPANAAPAAVAGGK